MAEPSVGTRDAFRYIVDRTLMRPRDLLTFLHRAVGVAINRGHARISEADIVKAEEGYSEDMLLNAAFELRDVYPEMVDVLYLFARTPAVLAPAVVETMLREVREGETERQELLELLVWFGFLGVQEYERDEQTYAYQVRYNLEKLLTPVRRGRAAYAVHPAFHKALGTTVL